MSKILSILGLICLLFSFHAYSSENYTSTEGNVENVSSVNQQRWRQVNSDLKQIKNKKDFSAMKQTMDTYYRSHHGIILPKSKNKTFSRAEALQDIESFTVISGAPWTILLTIVGKWEPYYSVTIDSNENYNNFWAFFISGDFEIFDYFQQADAKRVYAQWHVISFYPLIIAIDYPKNSYSIVYSVQIRDYLTYFAMYLKNITQNEKGNPDVYDADIVLSRDKF